MKLPRDCNGSQLVQALRRFGYEVTRQNGSHIRVTTQRDGEHHVTIPKHSPLRVGTLHSLLKELAHHHGSTVEEMLKEIKL